MTSQQSYRRVLLKISGETFCGPNGHGVSAEELSFIAGEIVDAASTGVQLAVVVGGGNMIRGKQLAANGLLPQATADYMGMLATVINGLALKDTLEHLGQRTRLMTAINLSSIAEPFIRARALNHLDKGRVVILAAGTGNPFFTTDSCAALRGRELDVDVVLKATKVDGVYDADPEEDRDAKRYDRISFQEAMEKQLRIMDMTALSLCMERGLPIVVFKFREKGNIRRVIEGNEDLGTRIS
jgi:uridylate kinase